MKKWLLILLVPAFCQADNSNTPAIASSIYEQLDYDTTGTAKLPRELGLKFARAGVSKVGWDIGKDTLKICTLAASTWRLEIDTAFKEVFFVAEDSGGKPRRALTEIPYKKINKILFDGSIGKQHPTHFAIFGTYAYFGPLTTDETIYEIAYSKKHAYLSDSTTTTDLPEQYRDLAVLWGAYKASERLQNGRAQEFIDRYILLRNDIKSQLGNTVPE